MLDAFHEPACSVCDDAGFLIGYDPNLPAKGRIIMPCTACEKGREAQQRYYDQFLTEGGLPERYRQYTFDTFRALPKEARAGKQLAYAGAYLFATRRDHRFTIGDLYDFLKAKTPKLEGADPARRSLVLYGAFGVGKTGLAAAIFNHLLGQSLVREAALYVRVQDLLHAVQKTYDQDYRGESRDAMVWRIKTAPVLILDEFGLHTISNDRSEIMEEIMRYRCGRDLPFVSTTNDAPDGFRKAWGGRIAEVMLEAAHWIPMGEPSLRNQVQP